MNCIILLLFMFTACSLTYMRHDNNRQQQVNALAILASWFDMSAGHTVENHTALQVGTVEDVCRKGRPRQSSMTDNIKEWTDRAMSSLLRTADDRNRWAAEASVGRFVVTEFQENNARDW